MYRIGFACKYMHDNQNLPKKELEAIERSYNTRTVTLKWLRSVDRKTAEERLFEVIEHNLSSQYKILTYVNTLPEKLKMMRISSDLLPLYTHKEYAYFYSSTLIKEYISSEFSKIGEFARKNNIRLSMHPGQFCVLASDRPDVVLNSIDEFEYHADMIRMMGYGQQFQDFKCNVHIAGGLGVDGVLAILPKLSDVAKNTITFENEERKYGLDDCLKLSEHCPVVLDIHHCWINEGDYIEHNDDRIKKVIDSWRGVRPTMHYSQSRESLLDLGFDSDSKLDMTSLLEQVNKKDLSAHSDKMWNHWCNLYAKEFLNDFDIMFEAKHKNLAVLEFYKKYLI